MYQSTCIKCDSPFEQPRDSTLWGRECPSCIPPKVSASSLAARACDVCGSVYQPKSNRSTVCSTACTAKRKALRKGVECSICGELMYAGSTTAESSPAHRKCRLAQHGNPNAYRRGCRCDDCRASVVQVMREYTDAYTAKNGISPTAKLKRARNGQSLELQNCTICGDVIRLSRFDGSDEPAHKRCRGFVYVPAATRLAIYERDNYECHLCGEPTEPGAATRSPWSPSLDHLIPKSHGGDESMDNLKTSHLWCNTSRSNRSIESFVSSISA